MWMFSFITGSGFKVIGAAGLSDEQMKRERHVWTREGNATILIDHPDLIVTQVNSESGRYNGINVFTWKPEP